MKTHMKWLVPRLIADTLAMTLMGAASSQDILTYSGTDQQVKLVVNARKEGKLTVYSSMAVNQLLRSLIEGFTKKIPIHPSQFLVRLIAPGRAEGPGRNAGRYRRR